MGFVAIALAIAGHARAEEPAAADGTPVQASDLSPDWRLRFDLGGGLAKLPEETDLAVCARAGLAGEYWFSKHFGIGGELGASYFGSLDFGDGENEAATWETLAPAISVRGRGRRSFPMLSLAGGVTRSHVTYASCDDDTATCYSGSYDAWGPYVALTGAAVMDVGDGLEFGAFMRVEAAALFVHPRVIDGSGSFTFGLSIGFDGSLATTVGGSGAARSTPRGVF